MWWILVLVLAGGGLNVVKSAQSFETQDACDAALPGKMAELKAHLDASDGGARIADAKCMSDDEIDAITNPRGRS